MKTILLIFTLSICVAGEIFAQTKEIDSLKLTLTKFETLPKFEADTNYLNTLNELAFKYYTINPDTTLILAEKSIGLAKQSHYEKIGRASCRERV